MSTSNVKVFKSHTLAPVQRKTLEYLRNFVADRGFAPTLKDISMHIGVKSPSTAHFHLARLEDKGFIVRSEDGSIQIIDQDTPPPSHGDNSVPLLGTIAAGHPIEVIEDSSVYIELPQHYFDARGEIYCLQVAGDSMIGAHIMDGDIIVVRNQSTAEDGQIVVAVLEDETATLKTFRRLKGGKIMLIPHNPEHKPLTLDNVSIRGRMIGLIREY